MIDTLSWIFLESPIALGVLCGFTLFWLLVYWRRGGSPRPLLIGIIVCALLFVAQSLIQTTRERVLAVMERIEADVLVHQAGALQASLAPGFLVDLGTGAVDRFAFVGYAKAWLERLTVTSLTRTELKITPVDSATMDVQIAYLAQLRYKDYAGLHPSSWRIRFVRVDDKLQITAINPVNVAGAQGSGWAGIRD